MIYAPVVQGELDYWQRVKNLFGSSLVGYWPLWEAAGPTVHDVSGNGRHGTAGGATPPTFGQPGVGDGRTSVLLPANHGYLDLYASISPVWSGAEGSLMLWAKVAGAGNWTDGVGRYLARFENTASTSYVRIYKGTAVNNLSYRYAAGGTVETINATTSSTEWMHVGLTWSKAADRVVAYLDGVQVWAPTGLGVWAGAPDATLCVLGSSNAGLGAAWNGWMAHALLLDREASGLEVAKVQSFFG